MAKANNDEAQKKPKTSKKQLTVRERTQKAENKQPRRIRTTAGKIKGPFGRLRRIGAKEYHMPLPENKAGRIGRKRVKLIPNFMRNAWTEIKLVKWPTRRETVSLTLAVFIFAVVFAVIVGLIDYGLDKLFREVIVKR